MYNFYDGGEGVSEERDEIEVDADASVDHHQNGDMMMLDVGCVPQSLCSRKVSANNQYYLEYLINLSEPGLILIARW